MTTVTKSVRSGYIWLIYYDHSKILEWEVPDIYTSKHRFSNYFEKGKKFTEDMLLDYNTSVDFKWETILSIDIERYEEMRTHFKSLGFTFFQVVDDRIARNKDSESVFWVSRINKLITEIEIKDAKKLKSVYRILRAVINELAPDSEEPEA